jgi:dipicolinate synthase subunit A
MMKIGLLGGDQREEILISLLEEKGYKVNVLKTLPCKNKDIQCFTEMEKVVKDCSLVVAPMSSTDEDGYLKHTFVEDEVKLDSNFAEMLDQDTLFMIGIARPVVKDILLEERIRYIEMAKLKDIAILNAIPTAEGAIKEAIDKTDYTLFNSKILIAGLGKVGLTLAWRLKALGAETYAVTRDKGVIARGRDLGLRMVSYDNLANFLPEMNILFNTVPALIFDESYISLMKKSATIIDLASSPGGTDFSAAEKRGINAFQSLGLPGKVAPKTSAEIMAEVIEENVNSLN